MTKPIPDFEKLRTPHNHRESTVGTFAQAGYGPTAIGKELGRAKSTVSRELNRLGAGARYGVARAQAFGGPPREQEPENESADSRAFGRSPRGIDLGLEPAADRGKMGTAGAFGGRAPES